MDSASTSKREIRSPSSFLRELRPEYYSDTEDRITYALDRGQFEYHLETLTNRNQTQAFEIFCRKLCERAICPNLRGQTGPDGGGDSKADAESFPVATEISALYFEGDANAASERWAFAFSAKEKWQSKVRDDVRGIVETGRKYARIICVTSRFAKSKARAAIEDELTALHGLPVTIHDRSWIVEQIIDNDRKDIAFNYLNVGEPRSDPLGLGPSDYSRLRQLAEIEKALIDPSSFDGSKMQRATEALLAAKLSRGLEKPRSETEGRFMRAIRLADDGGSRLQQLEANYELIWTSFWWFDDVNVLNSAYDSFETLLGDSDHSQMVALLCNLNQILFNAVIHKWMSADQLKLAERTERLEDRLRIMAADGSRPNNQLEAQMFLLVTRVNRSFAEGNRQNLSKVWNEFGEVLERARGLGEFDAKRLVSYLEAAANAAGDDPAYTDLVEKLSEFVAERTSEAEGALILLRRARKLNLTHSFDLIRILGRAVLGLSKREHASDLIDALILLALAYRSAGLLWACRATCIYALATISIKSEEDGEYQIEIIPVLKLLAWSALELTHVPDFIAVMQLLNGAASLLHLREDLKKLLAEDLTELDAAMGSIMLNLDAEELVRLSESPDIIQRLGLWTTRLSLLFAMGHSQALREEQSIPDAETEAGVSEFFSLLASQPVAVDRRPLVANSDGKENLETSLLGMRIKAVTDGSDRQIILAEMVLGALEATFATIPEQKIAPHTDEFEIAFVQSDEITEPSFDISELDVAGVLNWPSSLEPTDYANQGLVQRCLLTVAMQVLGFTCSMDDFDAVLTTLVGGEAVQQRIALIQVAPTSFFRLWRHPTTRFSNWDTIPRRRYDLKLPLPKLKIRQLTAKAKRRVKRPLPSAVRDHRSMTVLSIINVHAWNPARWRGLGFGYRGDIPAVFVLFEQEVPARKIFERWRKRVGSVDENGLIRFSIVREIPNEAPHHYFAIFSSKEPELDDLSRKDWVVMANRSMFIEPSTDANLNQFLKLYKVAKRYILCPWVVGQPDPIWDLGILKTDIIVRTQSEIPEGDVDWVGLRKGSPR